MALASGTKLGPYEIQQTLGAGGMGEVYRARDARLHRTVAVKILPQSLSSDQDRLERFQQEAQILSALNHPNLMAIYDVGSDSGTNYLVSEFLDGQPLREIINAGPLSQRKVTEYGIQIARGLAAAHDKGIVHRDLKPENVFVLRDGQVKILDFGLAKQAVAAAGMGDNATMTSSHRTAVGTVMGTAAYMSPEQVRGEAVDSRSDIFSLGAMLYEMISGDRAFKGDSAVEVMNAILKQEPRDLVDSGFHISVGLQKIVQRCLEKKPEGRFQSASDLAFALDSLSSGSTSTGIRAVKETKAPNYKALVGVVTAAILVVAAIAFWLLRPRPSSKISFTQISFRSEYIRNARIAPDGRTVVYGALSGGKPMSLFSTRTDTAEAQPLHIDGDVLAASSTGELAVLLHPVFHELWVPTGRLARMPLGGGSTRELLDDVTDADWSPDSSALAVSHQVGSHWQLEYPVGKVLYQTNGYVSDLRISPSGDKIGFLDHPLFGDDRGFVNVVDLQGNRKVLSPEYSSAQGLAWSSTGDEIWFTASPNSEANAVRAVDLKGHLRVVLPSPARLHLHDVGKDGRLLLSTQDFRWQDFLVDKATGQPRDITAFPWQEIYAISNDGQMLLLNSFSVGSDNNYPLYIQRADGSPPVMIGEGSALGFSFDNKWALALDPVHLDQVKIIPAGIGDARTVHAPKGMHYNGATFMPDGKHLLIVAAAPGHAPATYVQDIETEAVRQISPEGKYVPTRLDVPLQISPDGKYCILTDSEDHLWIQAVDGGAPKELQGVHEGEFVVAWHNDSQNVFVSSLTSTEAEIYTLNVTNGQRKLWTHYSPLDKTAALALHNIMITPDGAHYAYGVPRIYSTLYIAQGIR